MKRSLVLARDLEIGKKYKKDGVEYGALLEKKIGGYGGVGYQEPYYSLLFETFAHLERALRIRFSWDEVFEWTA
jgi:hypothetical protein